MSTVESENEPMAPPDEETTTSPDKPVCNACMVLFPTDQLTRVPCSHRYCPKCLKSFFIRAMKDETFYPPACCAAKIPIRIGLKHVTKTFTRRYKAKQLEMKTRNRTYCHRPTCSAFIAPHSIHNGHACCQRCGATTCAVCRSAWHWGPCPEFDETGFFEFIKTTEWKPCPECKRMVEKSEGCDHITCRCGNNFCYGCGRNCNMCHCDTDEENEVDVGCTLFD